MREQKERICLRVFLEWQIKQHTTVDVSSLCTELTCNQSTGAEDEKSSKGKHEKESCVCFMARTFLMTADEKSGNGTTLHVLILPDRVSQFQVVLRS